MAKNNFENPVSGLVVAISSWGVGKTTFGLTCGYQPEDMIFVNDDLKTPPKLKYKAMVDLMKDCKGMKPLELHDHCIAMIEDLPEAKVIIWDTWRRFGLTFPIWVRANKGLVRNPSEWSQHGGIRLAEEGREAAIKEGEALATLKSKADLVVVTFHVQQKYLNGKAIPNQFRPEHTRAFDQYTDLRVWLTPSPGQQEPMGLVLKNLAQYNVTPTGLAPTQVLPPKMPKATWPAIWEYWEDPVGNRELTPDEIPTVDELALVAGTLTPEQLEAYKIVAQGQSNGQADEGQANREQAIRDYVATLDPGLTLVKQSKAIQEAIEGNQVEWFGEKMTPGLLARIIKDE